MTTHRNPREVPGGPTAHLVLDAVLQVRELMAPALVTLSEPGSALRTNQREPCQNSTMGPWEMGQGQNIPGYGQTGHAAHDLGERVFSDTECYRGPVIRYHAGTGTGIGYEADGREIPL